MLLSQIHFCLSLFLIIFSLFVFFQGNPIYSVLFLILCFISAAFILIIFKINFLGLAYIMVYVGAIAILFLFIIMMINIRNNYRIFNLFDYFIFFLSIGVLFFTYTIEKYKLILYLKEIQLLNNINEEFILKLNNLKETFNYENIYSEIQIFGQILYIEYGVHLLIIGFLLLVTLIGSIFLTLNLEDVNLKKNKDYKQLSRHHFNSFFK
jgi:NADH:ubiquinone oxidoreductase subunit 6 (subunit J)